MSNFNDSESRSSEPQWQHAGTRGKQTQSNYEWNYGIYDILTFSEK